ncbi:hypothetical protein BH09PAT2_BH09PAT2_08240 [soil metagenome]
MNFSIVRKIRWSDPLILLVVTLVGIGLLTGISIFNKKYIAKYKPRTRTYYIAAENVEWNYAPAGKDPSTGMPLPEPWGIQTKYQKTRYIEYTDATFQKKKPQPKWLGILGPIIRGVEGDTLKVVFFNNTLKPYSMHPHGVLYDKDNEGAIHDIAADENKNHQMGTGAIVYPTKKHTYTWVVRPEAAPTAAEGGSKVWMYHSHVDAVADIYEGLIGPIIITRAENANEDATPNDVDQEFVNLFMVFNESQDGMTDDQIEGSLKHSINGYIFHNLSGLEMKQNDRVRWHLIGMGTEVDLHTPHWHGEVVRENGHYTDVVDLLPATMKSVDMVAKNVGEWMYHCHVADHITAGMVAMYSITGSDHSMEEHH